MATYRDIKGYQIQSLDSDPVPYVGTWSSGNDMNEGRYAGGGAGTQSAALAFGGTPPITADTESYNGSAWSEVNELNTARQALAGVGTQPAALAVTGRSPPGTTYNDAVEKWNGTSWTETGEINTARRDFAGMGTSTAGLVAGGEEPSNSAKTESWNGTSWTEVNDLATARGWTGSATASPNAVGLVFFGYPPDNFASTEEWNFPAITSTTLVEGQMWYNTSTLSLKTYGMAAGISAGSWASGTNLPGGMHENMGFGQSNSALAIAGGSSTGSPSTETLEYNGSALT